MIRNLVAKPALIVLGLAGLAVFCLATLVVLSVSVQATRTPAYSVTAAKVQQFDQSAENPAVAPSPESPETGFAPMPQSGDGVGAQQAPASMAAQAPHYAPASYGSAPAAATGWTEQASPDGTASLALPATWHVVQGSQGTVAIEGPSSQQVVLGLQTFVTANQAPYMTPEQALAWFMRNHGSQLLGVQNREVQQSASGQAELIMAESEIQGRKYKLVARVTTSQIGMGNWMLQISSMGAPVEHFDADFPTMKRIWNSWNLNKGYVQKGFDTAARIHQQTTTMAVNHAMNNVNRWNNFNESWDQTIRGVSTTQNSTLGKRYETPIGTEQQFLNNCTRRGMDCRQVPVNELVQPQ